MTSAKEAPGDLRAETIFRALSSSARLCIVRRLGRETEQCVFDLVGCCGLSWSTVSHHLSVLKAAGVVSDAKRGQQVFYRLEMPCVLDFLDCLEQPACGLSRECRPSERNQKRVVLRA